MAREKKAQRKPEVASEPPAAPTEFPVVGVGASAGGLNALELMFDAIPRDKPPGMAFVLVQHLAPDHESLLPTLVQRRTRLPVAQAASGMRVDVNHVYVIPPNRDMALVNGVLELREPSAPHGRRLPIDFFFQSLAQDRRESAVGVVLSGTGSDGTLGMRAIKAEGGLLIVQRPDSAQYDGMPTSAIATGLVDLVLSPEEMPQRLGEFAKRRATRLQLDVPTLSPPSESTMKSIFALLRNRTRHDFSQYKKRTIHRRIERRMAVNQLDTIQDYVRLLQQTPTEVDELFRDFLIGVTSFFRDPEIFEVLAAEIGKKLQKQRAEDTPFRVWVPGCSTGEEAYSIAIVLREQMAMLGKHAPTQIFATDIDSLAIEQARSGVFPVNALAALSPERVEQFFSLEPDRAHYRVRKPLRDMVIFSEQDIIRDPPFFRLDLISCRNLLIYMGLELQHKLMPMFYAALNPGGLLLLGSSESVGNFNDFFALVEAKSKLYLRKDDAPTVRRWSNQPPFAGAADYRTTAPVRGAPVGAKKSPLRDVTERALLLQHTPAAALTNRQGEILYLHGRTGRFLEPAPGEFNLNILRMAREGLGRGLRLALQAAEHSSHAVRRPGLRVKTNGDFTTVDLTVHPLALDSESPAASDAYLVVFEEPPPQQHAQAAVATDGEAADGDVDTRVAALERELRTQAEYLKTTAEDLETSNEDLRAANEELQSVNEELQSTNEELETSKEELQAVNEELSTVNAELQQRVAELSRSNNDLNNLMAGTGVGTIFLDHSLRIQRFTPAVTAVISLIPTDIGRPVGHIVANLVGYDRLVADARSVLDTLIPKDVEVRTAESSYLMRIRPYRTLDNVIEGVVITFTDISELTRTQAAMRRLAVVVHDSQDAIMMQDLSGKILAWNPAAERLYGWTEAEALTKNIRDLTPESQRPAVLQLANRLRAGHFVEPGTVRRLTKTGRTIDCHLTATALVDQTGNIYAISTTERMNSTT